jgi:hypothetical protein
LASDGFIREVDEELQRDRISNLWKRFGPLVISLALLVIMLTGAKVAWDAWQRHNLEQQGAAFAMAEGLLAAEDRAGAIERFSVLAESQDANAAALSRFREADARFLFDDKSAALSLLDGIAGAGDVDPIFRDFALITAAQHRLDGGDVPAALDSLEGRAEPGSAMHYSERETFALGKLEGGALLEAAELLSQLQADTTTPDDMRRRAGELLDAIGMDNDASEPFPTSNEAAP